MGILDQLFSDGSYRTELPGVRGMDVRTPMSVRGLNAVGDFIPGYGDVKAIGEAGQALTEGDLIAAGLLGTGAAIGLIPGAGDAIARPIMAAGRAAGNVTADAIGAYHSARSGDLGGILDAFAPSRPMQSLSAGVPSLKQDLGPSDAWLQGKLDRAARNRAEYGAEGGSLGNLGGQEGVTGWFSEPVTLDPRALSDVRGVSGEEAFRDTGEKLADLKRSIAEDGYNPTPIVIVVREDGVPFIAEGNHRLAEALQSGRQGIQAEIKYLRGAQSAEGILNPNNLPIAADPVAQRGASVKPKLGEQFDAWIDRIYAPENRGPRNVVQDENVVFRAMSPAEVDAGEAAGVFRDIMGNPLYVANDPERYIGGGAYGGKRQGRIYEFDVSGMQSEVRQGGVGIQERAISEIPTDRTRRIWEWNPKTQAHELIFDNTQNYLAGGI